MYLLTSAVQTFGTHLRNFFTKGPPATSTTHAEQGFGVVWRWLSEGPEMVLAAVLGPPPRFWAQAQRRAASVQTKTPSPQGPQYETR